MQRFYFGWFLLLTFSLQTKAAENLFAKPSASFACDSTIKHRQKTYPEEVSMGDVGDSESVETAVPRKRICYRIQIFTGGNSRQDRQNAIRMGQRCVEQFPELRMYTHFSAPRWLCRVGDFKTKADAAAYAKQIRKKKISRETSIVKCTIITKHIDPKY